MEIVDVLVVGGGPAGITAANRLAANGATVVVCEAGPPADDPLVHQANFFAARHSTSVWWPEMTARHTSTQAPQLYRQPQVFGGGATVNGMICTPGNPTDWAWAPAALPYLSQHMSLCQTHEPGPLGAALLTSQGSGHAVEMRLEMGFELASLWVEPDAATSSGIRRRRMNVDQRVTVRCGSLVSSLVTSLADNGTRVSFSDGTSLHADRVVLAGGAIQSATLARSLLRRGGSLEMADLVGSQIQDHPGVRFAVKLKPSAHLPSSHLPPGQPAGTVLARWCSSGALEPDLQVLVLDTINPDTNEFGQPHTSTGDLYGIIMIALTSPTSRGAIEWDSQDKPRLELNLLSESHDRARLREAVRRTVQLIESGALHDVAEAVYIDDRGTLLPASTDALFADDLLLDQWLLSHCGDYSHVIGSLPAGTIVGTGPSLGQLIGHRSIWVADASIFPHIPSANTMIPTMAVADAVAQAMCKTAAWG